MYEIGVLGLDTSHADTLARVMWKYHDAAVTAVWDGGAVRDELYREDFCAKYGAKSYETPEAMVDDVDAVLVLTKNPATHVELATPFLEAGVHTLVDKPVVASGKDLSAMIERSETGGATLFGGSAIPYHRDVRELGRDVPGRTIHCASYRGTLRYGNHVLDTVRKLMGSPWTLVEPSTAPGRAVTIAFGNGSHATVRFDGPMADAGFGFLDIGSRVDAVTIRSFSTGQPNADERDRERTYRAYLDRFFANVEGRRSDIEWIADAARLLLGCLVSLRHDEAVGTDDARLWDVDLSVEIAEMMERHVAVY